MASPSILNFNDSSPAAPAGEQNIKWQKGPQSGTDPTTGYPIFPASAHVPNPVLIGFIVNSGTTGTNIGPLLPAPRDGSVTKCVVAVKASDGATALTFTIKQNGTAIFTSAPTIAAGTAANTVVTFTTLTSSPLTVTENDLFTIDISSGSSSWKFTAQLK